MSLLRTLALYPEVLELQILNGIATPWINELLALAGRDEPRDSLAGW